MLLFYNPAIHPDDKSIRFDKKESRHIIKVLRKVNGDKLHVTNGKGFLFDAEIIRDNPNQCVAEIKTHSFEEPLAYRLHLAIAPTKRNDRFEWFLEKATEMGITEITPIICAHSERRQLKLKRFQRIIQSAMKQSLRYHLPQLNEPVQFSQLLNNKFDGQQFIAHCEKEEKRPLKDLANPGLSTHILIGPEGDFSTSEIQQALTAGFEPVSLGTHRLRTETAGIAACHTISLLNQ